MATNSGQFKPGNKLGGRRKGEPNKITMDQRAIFDEAISHEDRVAIVRSVLLRAFGNNDKEAAPYCKLIFEYVFSRPKIGHEVAVLNMEEVMSTEVCDVVWEAIQLEARERERHASQAKDQPRLEVLDAQVVGTTNKGNGRRNGPARNSRKKKANKKEAR